MKKILISSVLILLTHCILLGQTTLDYSNYTIDFDDEFEYHPATYPYPDNGIGTNAAFTSSWSPYICGYGGPAVFLPSQVTQPRFGVIRFTDDSMSSYSTVFDGYYSRAGVNHLSGGMYSTNSFSFGILEASIKIVKDEGAADPNGHMHYNNSAFWTDHHQQNEIDIIDASENNWICDRNMDYSYWSTCACTLCETEACGYGSTTDYSAGFHSFAAVWTPTTVKYYIDSVFVNEIDYSRVRIYQGFEFLELAMNADSFTNNNKFMEVDWIRVWRPKCNDADFDLSPSNFHTDVMTLPYLPDMLKYKTIEIEMPMSTSGVNVVPGKINGTTDVNGYGVSILEGEAVTILPDFLADQSTPQSQIVTLYSCGAPSMTTEAASGGYFEILPLKCGTESTAWYRTTNGGNNSGNHPDMGAADNMPFINSNSQDNTHIQIFPNPTENNITITYSCNTAGQLEISIKDLAGKVMHTESVGCAEGNNVQHTVDMSAYSSGVYFVEITLNDQHVVKKIVKL